MNSLGGGAMGGANGGMSSGAVGGTEAMGGGQNYSGIQQYGAGATGLSGLLNPGMIIIFGFCLVNSC